MQKISVGVIYGGRSVEHEISIISAVQAMKSFEAGKYQIVPIYISKDGAWYTGEKLLEMDSYRDLPALLAACHQVEVTATCGAHKLVEHKHGLFAKDVEIALDVVLPVMHGAHGEDGCLQGLFEMMNIPYAGPGVLGAAIGMDKIVMKAVLQQAGVPQVPFCWFDSTRWYDEKAACLQQVVREIGFPVIVKPANLGSSVGISKANDEQQLSDALDEAAHFTQRLLVEKCVENLREINCSVLGLGSEAQASICEEPITDNAFLTYQDKYVGGGKGAKTKGMSGSKRQIPADLPAGMAEEVQRLALRSFSALDGSGVARIDFLLDKSTNCVYVNEINTIPGSLSFYLWKPMGLEYSQLLEKLLQIAFKRQRVKDGLTFSYSTNILANAGSFGGGVKK